MGIWGLLLINFSICVCGSNYAYNTHSYLGKMADDYLRKFEPELYNKVLNVIGETESFETVSSWADTVKRNRRYSWTSKLHYIDIMECRNDNYSRDIIEHYCNNECVISGMLNFTETIRRNFSVCENWVKPMQIKLNDSEMLRFMVHFMQDFNQPMHLLGYNRGGNDLKLKILMPTGRNRTLNLHALWDTLIPEYYTQNYEYTYKYQVPRVLKNKGDYYNLLQEIVNENIKMVACKIYPDSDYLIFKDYFKEEYMKLLFDNYMKLMINTMHYIFN